MCSVCCQHQGSARDSVVAAAKYVLGVISHPNVAEVLGTVMSGYALVVIRIAPLQTPIVCYDVPVCAAGRTSSRIVWSSGRR